MREGYKISVFDKNDFFREGTVSLINSFENFEVILATDDVEILIAQDNAKPDICLLDIDTAIDIGEALFILQAKWPGIKIMALSLYNQQYTINRMFQMGITGYLTKNADTKELHRALLTLLFTGYYVNKRNYQFPHKDQKNKNLSDHHISETEMRFLELFCSDQSNDEIAALTKLSLRNIELYLSILCKKLNAKSRIGLITNAYNIGIMSSFQSRYK